MLTKEQGFHDCLNLSSFTTCDVIVECVVIGYKRVIKKVSCGYCFFEKQGVQPPKMKLGIFSPNLSLFL